MYVLRNNIIGLSFTKNHFARFEVDTAVFIPVKTESNGVSEDMAAFVFRTRRSKKCLGLLAHEAGALLNN